MPFNLDDYEPVEDRLRAFWSEHPAGRVVTVLVEQEVGHYIIRAEVFRDENGLPSASGLAEEMTTDRGVNSTSALENCETSAIGRALANLGYAAKGKRPSREEMSKTSPAPGPAGTAGAGTSEPHPTAAPQAGASTSVPRSGGGAPDAGPKVEPTTKARVGTDPSSPNGLGEVPSAATEPGEVTSQPPPVPPRARDGPSIRPSASIASAPAHGCRGSL